VRFGALAALLPQNAEGGPLRVDESDGLVFRGGLIPSRAYRELMVLAVAPARARLSLRGGGQGVTVENALGARIVRGAVKQHGVFCTFFNVPEGEQGPATCLSAGARPDEVLDLMRHDLAERFHVTHLEASLLSPLEDDEFTVALDRSVFAPDGGLRLEREKDVQLVRGRLSP
jgi:hypothetical protein